MQHVQAEVTLSGPSGLSVRQPVSVNGAPVGTQARSHPAELSHSRPSRPSPTLLICLSFPCFVFTVVSVVQAVVISLVATVDPSGGHLCPRRPLSMAWSVQNAHLTPAPASLKCLYTCTQTKAVRGLEALASLGCLQVALAQLCLCSRHRPLVYPFDTSPSPPPCPWQGLCTLLLLGASSSSGQWASVPFLHSPGLCPAWGLSSPLPLFS